MRVRNAKKAAVFGAAWILMFGMAAGCGKQAEESRSEEEVVELIWYQVGDVQKDDQLVTDEVNRYISEKIGAKVTVVKVGWGDYSQKMQVIINTNDRWDLCFTSSWTNDYLQNAQKGVFLELDDYLEKEKRCMSSWTFVSGRPRKWAERFTQFPAKRRSGTALCGCLQKNM